MVPTGPWLEAMRNGNCDVVVTGNCQSVVNPLLDMQKVPAESEKYVLDTCARVSNAMVVPDHPLPVVCEGLEDQPEPLPQSGLVDRLARQVDSW
jgi:hypothetical protein